MIKKWYVKFSDSSKAEEFSFSEFCEIHRMASFYNAIVSSTFHPHGKTMVVSFNKHFV